MTPDEYKKMLNELFSKQEAWEFVKLHLKRHGKKTNRNHVRIVFSPYGGYGSYLKYYAPNEFVRGVESYNNNGEDEDGL
jgi:hypothetical protein